MERCEWPALCQQCGKRNTIRFKTMCAACRQGQPHDSTNNYFTLVLPQESTKSNSVRQFFLTKWYGHGGCHVSVLSTIAIYSVPHFRNYTQYQFDMVRRQDGNSIVNERRLFSQDVLPVVAPCAFDKGALCSDTCPVCDVAKYGLPMQVSPVLKASSSGPAAYLSQEPPLHAIAQLPERAEDGSRQIYVAFWCKVTLGRSGWSNTHDKGAARASDSIVVEESDGRVDFVLRNPSAVLPTYALLFVRGA